MGFGFISSYRSSSRHGARVQIHQQLCSVISQPIQIFTHPCTISPNHYNVINATRGGATQNYLCIIFINIEHYQHENVLFICHNFVSLFVSICFICFVTPNWSGWGVNIFRDTRLCWSSFLICSQELTWTSIPKSKSSPARLENNKCAQWWWWKLQQTCESFLEYFYPMFCFKIAFFSSISENFFDGFNVAIWAHRRLKAYSSQPTDYSPASIHLKGILLFLLFLDTFGKGWKVHGALSFPLFPDTSTELSAAGAKRGVCNCIRTTIPSRPAGRRTARA